MDVVVGVKFPHLIWCCTLNKTWNRTTLWYARLF